MSPVIWNRIEPIVDATSVDAQLLAPLADPLWLLGRQWQVGELTAEDAGTPIVAAIDAVAYPIDRLTVNGSERAITAGLPLEALVEPEPPAPPDLRARLAAGRDLQAMLAGHATAAAALRSLATPAPPADRTGAALVRALGGRAIDGELVLAALATRDVAAALAPAADAAEKAAIGALIATWADGYRERTGRAAPSAWNDERAAYAFSLTAAMGARDVVLDAGTYRGGTLDWCELTASTVARPAPAPLPPTTTSHAVPAPLEFKGGPARRFFEIERGGASFGWLAGAAPDLATAVLVDVALAFGGDWFTVPVGFPVGSLAQIAKISVTDTFGDVHVLQGRIRTEGRDGWRMFECSGDAAVADLLPILPTVSGALEGPAIEAVALGQDEAANLVWAIEDTLADALGLPVRVPHQLADLAATDLWKYEPLVPPPTSWFPLVRRGVGAASRFVGATVRGAPASPQGRLLAGWPAVSFQIDDVPHDGLRVERRWQLAIGRAVPGQPRRRALWIARTEHNGRGPIASGTLADQLLPPTP